MTETPEPYAAPAPGGEGPAVPNRWQLRRCIAQLEAERDALRAQLAAARKRADMWHMLVRAQRREILRGREERDAARAKLAGACDVCWTASMVPADVPEAECRLVHPHDGPHAICDSCRLQEAYLAVHGERDALRAQLVAARKRSAAWHRKADALALLLDVAREDEQELRERLAEMEVEIIIYRACANGMALEGLKALMQMTGSFNSENPWLGVTSAVALLKIDEEKHDDAG